MDGLSRKYASLLTGNYDCVDRIVLNGYFSMAHDPGGFRIWWRQLTGSEDTLDNAHLMRMAGRFSRRLPGGQLQTAFQSEIAVPASRNMRLEKTTSYGPNLQTQRRLTEARRRRH